MRFRYARVIMMIPLPAADAFHVIRQIARQMIAFLLSFSSLFLRGFRCFIFVSIVFFTCRDTVFGVSLLLPSPAERDAFFMSPDRYAVFRHRRQTLTRHCRRHFATAISSIRHTFSRFSAITPADMLLFAFTGHAETGRLHGEFRHEAIRLRRQPPLCHDTGRRAGSHFLFIFLLRGKRYICKPSSA